MRILESGTFQDFCCLKGYYSYPTKRRVWRHPWMRRATDPLEGGWR